MSSFSIAYGEQRVTLEVLVDGGPLCVAPCWDWTKMEKIHGLYCVYFKRLGRRFGPFYAEIPLADKDMRKALKAFPSGFWDQALEWYLRQKTFAQWIGTNMGQPEDLVGAEWAKD